MKFARVANTKMKPTMNFHNAKIVQAVVSSLMLVKTIKNIKYKAIVFNVHRVNSAIQEHRGCVLRERRRRNHDVGEV